MINSNMTRNQINETLEESLDDYYNFPLLVPAEEALSANAAVYYNRRVNDRQIICIANVHQMTYNNSPATPSTSMPHCAGTGNIGLLIGWTSPSPYVSTQD